MKTFRLFTVVTTTLMTEVRAADPDAAIQVGKQRQIARVHPSGSEEDFWVVPDGSIEREGLPENIEVRELDDDDQAPRCPKCDAEVVADKTIVACGACKTLLAHKNGLLRVATPDEVDAAAEVNP